MTPGKRSRQIGHCGRLGPGQDNNRARRSHRWWSPWRACLLECWRTTAGRRGIRPSTTALHRTNWENQMRSGKASLCRAICRVAVLCVLSAGSAMAGVVEVFHADSLAGPMRELKKAFEAKNSSKNGLGTRILHVWYKQFCQCPALTGTNFSQKC